MNADGILSVSVGVYLRLNLDSYCFPVDGVLIMSRLKKEFFEHVPIALLQYP
jgi:hypothetical protein